MKLETLKKNLKPLDWDEILNRLESFATSESARKFLRELEPLSAADEAMKSFSEIGEALIILGTGERPFMQSLDLFSTWYQRLKREAVLQTLELRDVRQFCIEVIALSEVLRPLSGTWLNRLKENLMDATRALSAIDQLMTANGEIRTDASQRLYELYQEKQQQTRALQGVLDRLVKAHETEHLLQDKYVTTREGRWVIPIKSGMQHHFDGIIHAQSQSKQTVYMEPDEVVPLNNRLRQIDADIEMEIERLLTELSAFLKTLNPEFEASQKVLIEADIRLAQAKLTQVLEAQTPEFSEQSFELRDVRHPLLVLKNETVVSNSVILDHKRRILLLSGPNAGGKTVLLKSVGLAAHMARCGLPICADRSSRLPFFESLFVGVGDAQSVDARLSTFAAHVKVLSQATEAVGHKQLLLIDEICGSTDPEEGSALARGFIEVYARNHVFGVITSHLGPLKVGWQPDSGVINGSLEYSPETGQPTYQFLMGVPGQSLALLTARRVGVSEDILERAVGFLSPASKAQHQHLREIEATKEELKELRRKLQQESQEASQAKQLYQQLLQKFRQEKDQWLERTVKKAEKKIDEMIDKAQVENVFRKHERLAEIKRELPEVIKGTGASASVRKKIETVEEFEQIYPPGSVVFVPSIGQEGVIQGKANNKGEIPVLSNSMRLFVSWRDLKPPQSLTNPTQNILRRTSGVHVTLQSAERIVDVRGKHVDEAISQIETELDAAVLANEDRVKIVHGHGTEALKKAVRTHLSRSVYVKKWKAAAPETGGDGVTWAELKD